MKFGNSEIYVVSDGSFKMDGGAIFGVVPKAIWSNKITPDPQNCINIALNCILIKHLNKTVLIDTGIGTKLPDNIKTRFSTNSGKLVDNLKNINIDAQEIDYVIITHLHFDHCGGCTKLDRSGTPVPTFTKAKVMVQRSCWEEANDPLERSRSLFDKEDFAPLEESGALSLLDGDSEIVPGVKTRVTNGHSQGHQIVLVEAGSERIAYLGDLIPTPYHVPLESISAYDHSPNVTLEAKREIVKMAIDGGWLLVFGHALDPRAGYIEQRNGRSQLFPVEV